MIKYTWLLALSLLVMGCASEGGEPSLSDEWPVDTELAEVEDNPEGNFGTLEITLPDDPGNGGASCSISIIRMPANRTANVMIAMAVFGKGCDGMGNCENPDMQRGDIMYSGGVEGNKPVQTMSMKYQSPSPTSNEKTWIYNAVFKANPFNSFELQVDESPFDILTSDSKGADNILGAPHVWDARFKIEADMLEASNPDQGVEARGTFTYEGLCEVSIKNM